MPAIDAVPALYEHAKAGNWQTVLQAMEDHPATAGLVSRYAKPTSGWTFLHQAAYWGNQVAAKTLIRYGANILQAAAKPGDGTPIDVATRRGHAALATLLQAAESRGNELWRPVPDPTMLASSSAWGEATKQTATFDMHVAYGGGTAEIPCGSTYWADACGRVLVGWHGTWGPPCGMDGETMFPQ